MQRRKLVLALAMIAAAAGIASAVIRKDSRLLGGPDWPSPVDWYNTEATNDAPAASLPFELGSYRAALRPACAWCSNRDTSVLEVHHIIPQRMWADVTWTNRPDYSMNDVTNLVTLCDQCHFVVGHRRNYRTGCVTNFWRMLEEANR
jgi:5-methylcytosine-specific restriction endonuclease McrA